MNSRDLISHPQVLWAAWLRVDAWYRSSELAPQPEFSAWKLHPEAELRKLRRLLRSGDWQPRQWTRVPYPKKGMSIRHYWMPTVRDQVVFMAHIVLLGPFLDRQIHNFAFGNRWYRPTVWDRRSEPAKWDLRAYPFLSHRTYLPYPRAHGLYRRVANWTVSRMVGAEVQRVDFSGPVQAPDDYPDRALPEWTRESWWPRREPGPPERAHWATLDLQLAYPSVRLDRLRESLEYMLRRDNDSFQENESFEGIHGGYPSAVVEALADVQVRLQIASTLMKGLAHVQDDSDTEIPQDAWRPPHATTQQLPPNSPGLPTGLAISGLLLNVLLHSADCQILNYLRSQNEDRRGAFLRFADDMTVLSWSPKGLFGLIDEVWRAISSDSETTLAIQESRSNLRLNVGKIGPDGVQKVLLKYLQHHKWKVCKKCNTTYSKAPPETSETLEQWWEKNQDSPDECEDLALLDKLNDETVGPNEMAPFVTTLVERLSEIGRDTLVERFGQGARTRLVQLHELARLDIDDRQVRPDTRRAFAANRLVAAWLPVEAEAARKQINDVRDSVALVSQKTPWKFALWRAVVRAAGQRPTGGDRKHDAAARKWLSRVLGRIAFHDPELSGEHQYQPDVWARTWPKADLACHCNERDPKWRSLYLSYHRAIFWQALANEIANLRRHNDRLADSPAGSSGPAPHLWAVRAIPEGGHGQVAEFLAELDTWVEILYGKEDAGPDLSSWPWELDQIVLAVLATVSRAPLAEALLRCKRPKGVLMVPEDAVPHHMSRTARLLHGSGRIQPSDEKARKLSAGALAHVYLGAPDTQLGSVLFPDNAPPQIDSSLEETRVVMTAITLECSDSIPTHLLSGVVARPTEVAKRVRHDALKLNEYAKARSILMSREDGLANWSSQRPTLHRLLWGPESGQDPLDRWKPRPWETPAVGLTVSLALRLFDAARSKNSCQVHDPKEGPMTWLLPNGHRSLAAGRRLQLGEQPASLDSKTSRPRAIRSIAWEVPPHAAYFLPFASGANVSKIDRSGFATYCDALLLLTALDGGEAILHGLVKGGAGSVPFADRWDWRSRIHVPEKGWRYIEQVVRWSEAPTRPCSDTSGTELALRPLAPDRISIEHHYLERVDIHLDLLNDLEVVRTVSPQGSADTELPEQLLLNQDSLTDNLVVRIGQVAAWPEKCSILSNFPAMDSIARRQIMEQVASAFQSKSMGASGRAPELVVLPEACVPEAEARTIRKLVEVEQRASLAGIYWRELRPVYPAGPRSRASRCWFVNEAELVIPVGSGRPGPNGSRWFRVRKPIPAHVETGLARALSQNSPNTTWKILKGQRWHRFLHPQWGDFSVAVCADLLDAAPWRSLRGELLHVFMVGFNQDVGLYEALTWVRAYETYVNLVAVNHGVYGGSFLWTPRRGGHERELAQLRGNKLFLLADVEVPVKQLALEQLNGVNKAVCIEECRWMECASEDTKFKAPPPGYQRRKE